MQYGHKWDEKENKYLSRSLPPFDFVYQQHVWNTEVKDVPTDSLAGAPIENNEAERLLKMAIRHRNNSLFFRTQHGADVADVYMTLIYTTQLHGENPFEYLTALQRHARQVAQTPADWLPWNYRDTLRLTAQSRAPSELSRAA